MRARLQALVGGVSWPPNYENTFDSEEYKNAYLHLLLDFYNRSSFIPSKNENHFQDLVDDYDVFTGNFDKVFVSTGDVDDVVNRDDALESFNAMSGAQGRASTPGF